MFYGIFYGFLWNFLWFSMDFHGIFYGFLWISMEFSMEFSMDVITICPKDFSESHDGIFNGIFYKGWIFTLTDSNGIYPLVLK